MLEIGLFIGGIVIGALFMVFVVRKNPKIILSAEAIVKIYKDIKE